MSFFNLVLPGLFDGYGKINYANINATFDILNISMESRPDLLEKILTTAGIKLEIDVEEQKRKNAKHKTRLNRRR